MNIVNNEFRSILIIDDNEAIHKDFAKIFAESSGDSELDEMDAFMFGEPITNTVPPSESDLRFASQGKEGFEILRKSLAEGVGFGLAFVDMRMPPGWDGVETIEHLWQVDPDLQVVICTAYSDRSWDEISERLGQTDRLLILKKPFDEIEVVQLASSLRQKRLLIEKSKRQIRKLEGTVEIKDLALSEAHKNAEVLIDSMSSALISTDEDGVVSRWNPVASTLFETPASAAIGTPFRSLPIEWVDKAAVSKAFRECSVVLQKSLELKFINKSGQTKTILSTICPIQHDASLNSRLMMATDISTQKQMQSQLDQAMRMESVGQLAAGVAHEINTPMQYIGDNVRFVARTLDKLENVLEHLPLLVDPEVTEDQFRTMRESILQTIKPSKVKSSLEQIPEALQDTIEGVVSVAKIVAAMKEFSHPGSEQKSQVCINHILDSTITVAKNEWKYVADLETNFAADIGKIEALPSELNQAFLNIIVNAAHAIADCVATGVYAKGMLSISTQSRDDGVLITITDNGGGIPESIREKIFEPFFTTKDVGKGTGQGLSIAFSVVTMKHGGTIKLKDNEDIGTTFEVWLPVNSPGGEHDAENADSANVCSTSDYPANKFPANTHREAIQ